MPETKKQKVEPHQVPVKVLATGMREDTQQDYAYASAIASDNRKRSAGDFADKGFKNPVLSPDQKERRQELSRARTADAHADSIKFTHPNRPSGSTADTVVRGLNKDSEQAIYRMKNLTTKIRSEKKPRIPEEVEENSDFDAFMESIRELTGMDEALDLKDLRAAAKGAKVDAEPTKPTKTDKKSKTSDAPSSSDEPVDLNALRDRALMSEEESELQSFMETLNRVIRK